jgi:hypothetical protein
MDSSCRAEAAVVRCDRGMRGSGVPWGVSGVRWRGWSVGRVLVRDFCGIMGARMLCWRCTMNEVAASVLGDVRFRAVSFPIW